MRFLLNFTKFLLRVLDFAGKYGMIVLCAFVLSHAAMIESAYFTKYEDSFAAMEREHARQLVVGEMVNSQASWERTGEALRMAYRDERATRIKAERDLILASQETYHILRKLEDCYPEVYADVMKDNRLPASIFDIFELLDGWLKDELPDDGSMPELAPPLIEIEEASDGEIEGSETGVPPTGEDVQPDQEQGSGMVSVRETGWHPMPVGWRGESGLSYAGSALGVSH